MRDNAANSHDEMSYGVRVHLATDPDRLADIGTPFGMNPASPERCRVLELGCAGGGNLTALARKLPGSQSVKKSSRSPVHNHAARADNTMASEWRALFRSAAVDAAQSMALHAF
jgi:hypothetical protein